MILFLHNRYRTAGGEERTVEDLMWLVRDHLGEPAELLIRDSRQTGRGRAAAGLLRGGLQPSDVARAVRLTGARVVHAHNLHPTLGWRALAAARSAGARVVLHLHQYRLVCAIGVCYTRGADCTRCHGRNTLPGVRLNCRGSLGEAFSYGAALSLWQRRLVGEADAIVVPSVFARERLRALGAPLPWDRVHVLAPPVRGFGPIAGAGERPRPAHDAAPGSPAPAPREEPFALVVSRLAPEKGVDVAIAACRLAGLALVVAGEGPDRQALEGLAADPARAAGAPGVRGAAGVGGPADPAGGSVAVRFAGHVDDRELASLRSRARIALVPSRSGESFGIAAAEALAAGLAVAGSRVGALPDLLEDESLASPGDASGLAQAIARVCADEGAAARGHERARALCSPEVVARGLTVVYEAAADT